MSDQLDDVQTYIFFPLAYPQDKFAYALSDRHDVTVCNFHLEGFFKLDSDKSKLLYYIFRNKALLRAAINGRNNGRTCQHFRIPYAAHT